MKLKNASNSAVYIHTVYSCSTQTNQVWSNSWKVIS